MKDRTTAGILAILLGWLGVHKFYLGNTKGGIIYIILFLFCGIGGILGIVDGIVYLMDTDEKFQERIAANKVFDFA
ncbi:MAG: TM2 domain-containing protein [Bacteroidaceae bacterium]|nr:TM2 domain-containing protein [Bacteroidaceae bacterium]